MTAPPLIKLWFSVVSLGAADPVRDPAHRPRSGSGSCRPTDLAPLDHWDDYTAAKEAMFGLTDTHLGTVDRGQEQRQKRARLERHAVRAEPFDYPNRDRCVVGMPDPLIVGPASVVYEHGETARAVVVRSAPGRKASDATATASAGVDVHQQRP